MKIFNLDSPIKNSIIVYIIIIVIYIIFIQNIYKKETKDKKYLLPVIVITISILIYYVFKSLQIYYT
jgi:uncharacterized oligopeptide transporter (OPT) family protein